MVRPVRYFEAALQYQKDHMMIMYDHIRLYDLNNFTQIQGVKTEAIFA